MTTEGSKGLREGIAEPRFQTPDRPRKIDPYVARLTGWLVTTQRKTRKERGTARSRNSIEFGFEVFFRFCSITGNSPRVLPSGPPGFTNL